MSSYLELPTYTYDKMSINETRLFRRDFEKPVVIRGLYNPTAKNMSIDAIVSMFGDIELPMETYEMENTPTPSSEIEEHTMKYMFDHWKTNKPPFLYCAEVDLFEQPISDKLTKALHNPNTEHREIDEFFLFLGKNHKTGLHLHVNGDYILNQLFGSKTIYIFENYENANVRKNPFYYFNQSNFAIDDFFEMDHSKMKIYKTTLYPGDSLIIPPWYWHATHGHEINMSMTQTFTRRDESFIWKNPNLIFDYYFDYGPQQLIAILAVIIILVFILRRQS